MRATFSNEETLEKAPKEGIFTNLYVKHPLTNEDIPVYVANYVLSTYGTGAIFVPARDRDFMFKNFNLPIKRVIEPHDNKADFLLTGSGKVINSDFK